MRSAIGHSEMFRATAVIEAEKKQCRAGKSEAGHVMCAASWGKKAHRLPF
jgi:hypothetical protein